jgi:DNA-binding transcriptional LysR family regulator
LNKDPIDLRTLTALVTVADEGSFRGAARALGYTQSAISHQIATIERRLGISVFERPGGRGRIRLTPLGELAYQNAQRVIGATDALESDMIAALAGERGTVRIGISQSSCYVLTQPLAQLRRRTPGIEMSLINCATAETLAQQLDRGQLDVGVFVNIEPDERVVTIPLFEDAWMLLAHRDHALARSSSVPLDALDGAEMIAWHSRWRSQASLEQLWRRRRIRPRIVYRTDDSMMIQALVAVGLGCACLGALSVQELIDPRLRRITIRDEVPPRTLALCYARRREPPPAAAVLIDTIREIPSPAHITLAAQTGP